MVCDMICSVHDPYLDLVFMLLDPFQNSINLFERRVLDSNLS